MHHYSEYRDVDGAIWEKLAADMVAAITRQLNQARIEYALTIELGTRASYALVAEEML